MPDSDLPNLPDTATPMAPETFDFDTLTPARPIRVAPARPRAMLFRPSDGGGPWPAVVILSSSAGVQRHRERYYAGELARAGIAACVVDSFAPRGVRSTVADQSRVSAFEMECDAFAALRTLRRRSGIDPARIGIMGVSKGGVATVNAAIEARRPWRGVDETFALHVAVCPGCVVQHRDPATTGAPMFLMLAEHDDYTPARHAIAYAQRMRATGNAAIRVKVYKAHHGWESVGGVYHIADAQNFSRCEALVEDDGRHYVAAAGRAMAEGEYRAWARDHGPMFRGAHAGGGTPALKRRATDDLLAFLREHRFGRGPAPNCA